MKDTHLPKDEEVFVLLRKVGNATEKLVAQALQNQGVTVAEYIFLRVIQNNPGITAREARERLVVAGPSVAQLVSQLERKHLLTRIPHKHDARKLHLSVSPQGVQTLKAARVSISAMLKMLHLPANLLDSLIKHLTLLSSSLSSLSSHGTR